MLIRTSLLAVVKVSAQIHVCPANEITRSLSTRVFERRMSTGGETFFLLIESTLFKTDTFGTGTKCPSYRESNKGSKEGQRPTLSVRFTEVSVL